EIAAAGREIHPPGVLREREVREQGRRFFGAGLGVELVGPAVQGSPLIEEGLVFEQDDLSRRFRRAKDSRFPFRRENSPMLRGLASRIPDVPAWVELRGILLSGRGETVGTPGPGPADFIV